jgi:copper chaperone NosL
MNALRWLTAAVRRAGFGLAVVVLVACRPGPRPIEYGQDACAYCRMQIDDPRYGGELVMTTGKIYTFDSVECLVSYYQSLDGAHRAQVASLWVADFRHPRTLIPVDSAWFLHRSGPGSPMGRGMLAVRDTAGAAHDAVAAMRWAGVLARASRENWRGMDADVDGGVDDGAR